jgi:hypothetical protein
LSAWNAIKSIIVITSNKKQQTIIAEIIKNRVKNGIMTSKTLKNTQKHLENTQKRLEKPENRPQNPSKSLINPPPKGTQNTRTVSSDDPETSIAPCAASAVTAPECGA